MNKASPLDLRVALISAKALADAGILFVAVPVTGDRPDLIRMAADKLEAIAERTEEEEKHL